MSPIGSNTPPERHFTKPRKALYDAIQEAPGIHQRELQRRTGIPMGTMCHHLSVLQHLGYVESQETGMYRRFAPQGTPPEQYGEAAVMVQDAMNQDILHVIQDQPGAIQKDVIQELPQYKRGTIQNRLGKLTELGVLHKSHRQGTSAQYWTNGVLETLQGDPRG